MSLPAMAQHSPPSTPVVMEAALAALLPAIQLIPQHHAKRAAMEEYIHERFRKEYGADINSFMPWLITLQSEGITQAAIGFRLASHAPLFLETYLNRPIEEALTDITQLKIERNQLVEVGNLAATRAGSSASLFCALSRFLDMTGYEWVVICATPTVQNVFSKLGIPLIALAEATKDALPVEQQILWGNYYQCRPLVMAVHVKTAHRCVNQSRLGKHMLHALESSLDLLMQQWEFLSI